MKRYLFLRPAALLALALAGCYPDKPAPQLTSPDRNERIAAVRNVQSRYGASPAPARPAAAVVKEAAGGDDSKLQPIDGPWILKVTLGEQSQEVAVTIKDGELRVSGVDTYWKNIRRVPSSPARYSAVRVTPGLLYGTQEDPVEFYLDADGILHHDDAHLPLLSRCMGTLTLRRP
jgi:hypothetical protein